MAVPAFAGKVLAEIEYFYSDDGTLIGKAFNGKRVNFEYDLRGQLLAVKDAQGKDLERYTYDPAGNRLSKTINGVTTTYTYDKANQLVTSTVNGVTTHYKYDAAGRMIQAGDKTYIYNGQNKVSEVRQNGKTIAKFEYNIDGQIAKAIYGNKVEEFMWDGLALIWRSGVTYINEPYVTGGNPVMAGDDVLFNDMLGSTLAVNDKAVEMTSFGETTDKNAFFTGKPMIDELGYSFLFRDYNPNQGKWTTTDPLGYPDGWNNLAYVNNGVSMNSDFLGLSSGYYYYYNGYYHYSYDANYFVGGSVKSEINNLTDALAHYRSGAGGIVNAGAGLYAEMQGHSTYQTGIVGNDSRVAKAIKSELADVNKNLQSGTFNRSSFVGALECTTLGNYKLNYSGSINWTGSNWLYDSISKKYYRDVTANVNIIFTGSDLWDFEWNASYNTWQNVTRELIPGWVAGLRGTPAPFTIKFSTNASYNLSVRQYE